MRSLTTSMEESPAIVSPPPSSLEHNPSSEPAAGGRRPGKRGSMLPLLLALGFLFVAGPSLFAWCYLSGSFTPWARRDLPTLSKPAIRGDLFRDVDSEYPPVQYPQIIKAAAADLPDGLDVIGVTVAGKHRAYLVRALVPIDGHVVNDLVGSTPVTVSYCSRLGCARVFTAKSRGKLLDVSVAGWRKMRPEGGGLVLKAKGKRYLQKSGKAVDSPRAVRFPYPELAFTRTKWEVWKKNHPDTDLYVGNKNLFTPPGAPKPLSYPKSVAPKK